MAASTKIKSFAFADTGGPVHEQDITYTAGTSSAGAPIFMGADGDLSMVNSTNVGTAGAGVTAVDVGDGFNHVTTLTLACTPPAGLTAAALGWGNLIYTFPAGEITVDRAYQAPTITAADGNIDADTPDVGLGTVIATGVVSILSGTGTFENLVTGQTATNCTGTATGGTFGGVPTAAVPFKIAAAGAHTVHLNWADTWAGTEAATAIVGGTVRIFWTFMG